MSLPDLIVTDDDARVARLSQRAGHRMDQTYRRLSGGEIQRLSNGAGVLQVHWAKVGTRVEGQGRIPPALAALDLTAALTLDCMQPRSVAGPGPVLTLPGTLRPDTEPYAWAKLADRHVRTAVSMSGNEATVTTVAGAQQYEVLWWPRLTVLATGLDEEYGNTRAWRWRLDAEEA